STREATAPTRRRWSARRRSRRNKHYATVMPAKAGIHGSGDGTADRWVPAFPTDQVRGLKAHGTTKLLGREAVFDLHRFIEDCRAAVRTDPTHKAAREVVERTVSDPAGVIAGLGEPRRAEVQKLYHAPDLTILNVVWGPYMTVRPHNHLMWAVIGIYTGRENNIFWRRIPEGPAGGIEAAGAKSLGEREA